MFNDHFSEELRRAALIDRERIEELNKWIAERSEAIIREIYEDLENKLRLIPEEDRHLYCIAWTPTAEGLRPFIRLKSELLDEYGNPAFPGYEKHAD